jgi:radial spoke head protein 4A
MINHARKIRCLLTGCLSAPVNGFPGLEKDYLRAQIARITATTHISPAGFYILRESSSGEEEMTFNDEHKGKNDRISKKERLIRKNRFKYYTQS